MDVQALLKQMVDKGVSDIFIIAGRPLSFKLGNRIQSLNDQILTPALTRECILGIYALSLIHILWVMTTVVMPRVWQVSCRSLRICLPVT